ncbi:MAG TPA: ABC transporter substrate-binding protein [bacterium]|nr:ABC transporter substrate-binding protein [bacterium]
MQRSIVAAMVAILIAGGTGAGIGWGATPGPLVLGVLTPLSPPGDPAAGQLIVRGAQLGEQYINTVMGGVFGPKTSCALPATPVTVAVEDDSGTPEKSVAGFRRLVTEEHAVGVFGAFHSSAMLATAPLADELGVPYISTQASAADITGKHFQAVFRTHPVDPDRAAAWLGFIQAQGWHKVAMLAENTDYGIGLAEATKTLIAQKKLNMTLDAVIFDRTSADLTPQLLKFKAEKPDIVLNVGVGTPAYLIIKQAHDIGLFPQTPMLASYDFPVRPEEYWKNLGPTGTSLTFISYFHPRMALSPLGKWAAVEYAKRFHSTAVYSNLNSFGDAMILAEAMNQACSRDPRRIIAQLERGRFDTWIGDGATFPRGTGVYWHQWSPPLVILQYTKQDETYDQAPILYPPALKTGTFEAAH